MRTEAEIKRKIMELNKEGRSWDMVGIEYKAKEYFKAAEMLKWALE